MLADAAYGNDSAFREELEELGLDYVVAVRSSTKVWRPGEEPLPPKPHKGTGRRPKRLRRSARAPTGSPEAVRHRANRSGPSAA